MEALVRKCIIGRAAESADQHARHQYVACAPGASPHDARCFIPDDCRLPHMAPASPRFQTAPVTVLTNLRQAAALREASLHNAFALSPALRTARRDKSCRCAARLPVASVERPDNHCGGAARLEAACVDADSIGVGARHVKRLDAAHVAEAMPGN